MYLKELIQIFHGQTATFSLSNPGSNTNINSDMAGNHVPKVGLIAEYKNETDTFTEYLIEVDRNSYITEDDEKLFSFGEIMTPIKREIVYIEN